MKQILLGFIICFSLNQVKAQVRLGVFAGPSISTQKMVSNNQKVGGVKSRYQYHLGMLADIQLDKFNMWHLQPELIYSYQGSKQVSDLSNLINETTTNLGYFQLPAQLTFKHEFKSFSFYAGGGPYAGLLVNNNYRFIQNNENVQSGSLRVGKETTDQITRWDYGVKLKTGLELNRGFGFGIFYEYGTKDLSPDYTQTYNRVFGMNLSYLFGEHKSDGYDRRNYYNY
jgi:hypothetical protein